MNRVRTSSLHACVHGALLATLALLMALTGGCDPSACDSPGLFRPFWCGEGGGGGGGGSDASMPVCGNGVLEQGEECDDGNLLNGDGCSATCAVDEVNACINTASEVTDSVACQGCVCGNCPDLISACADGTNGDACVAVVACAANAGCTGKDCYCGDRGDALCAAFGPQGP